MLLKAVAGGGGRGMRLIESEAQLIQQFERAESEARAAFGDGSLYAERFLGDARHIEIQVIGDGSGAVRHLGERDCTIQRRYQKLVEIAPSPFLSDALREQLAEDACRMASALNYEGVGTFEFLVDNRTGDYAFIEANPRLQVEHTVTEEVHGIDLVQLQFAIVDGATLGELDIPSVPARGFALQLRITPERVSADGKLQPASGSLAAFDLPVGEGVRVETSGYAGYKVNPRYDSLLAKLVICSRGGDFGQLVRKSARMLSQFHVEGVETNISLLAGILADPAFAEGRVHTRFLDSIDLSALVQAAGGQPNGRANGPVAPTLAGARVDANDPLAILTFGKSASADGDPDASSQEWDGPGSPVVSPLPGSVVSVEAAVGETVRVGQPVLVLQAMKMEHVITAPCSGSVSYLVVKEGDAVTEGSLLFVIEVLEEMIQEDGTVEAADPDRIPEVVAEARRYHDWTLDAFRQDAVAKRHASGSRTARENIADLVDADSFVEYGQLVVAAGIPGSDEELLKRSPADGLVAGLATINGSLFPEDRSRAIVMSYDYTVFAGTQGGQNHRKHDRMFDLAEQWRIPVVFFTEGGGGRAVGMSTSPQTPIRGMGGLRSTTFWKLGKLSGLVPLVGVVNGRCFAGNAVVLGCCDAIIATASSTIGIGGPAMIEGGGLGVFRPEEVGPMSFQTRNGVVDIAVADEAEAVQAAKKYLSYFQGRVEHWTFPDQRRLRTLIPENRLRVYDVRQVIETMADDGSWLELRRHFARGMVTGFMRIEGRPVGLISNDPFHLGGAIDSDGADKAARFMQLCDAFDIPIVTLCDTPGIMVGPESEKTGAVRHASRMIVTAANITVPLVTIVLRKAYGLGALAMGGGSFHTPFFAVSWPTGEFGGMGFEGMVKLGFRDQLAAIEDIAERRALFDRLVANAYDRGKAINSGMGFEVEDVLDPADSRRWISAALRSVPPPAPRTGRKRPNVDTW